MKKWLMFVFSAFILSFGFINFSNIVYATDSPKIIFSLTSFPERFPNLVKTIDSIKNQTLKPDNIILYLSRQECTKEIPKDIVKSVEIHYVEDVLNQNLNKIKWNGERIRSYGKLIPALLEYPEDIIITIDDDEIYNCKTVEWLYNGFKDHNKCIINSRGRNVDFSFISNQYDEDYYMFEGVGGVLYPPHCFRDSDIFNLNLALKEFSTTDDIFFWMCALLNKTKTVNPAGNTQWWIYDRSNYTYGARSLWSINGAENCKINIENINKVFVLNPELKKLFDYPETGIYEIASELDNNMVLDISSRSIKNGAKLQLFKKNDTPAQRFFLQYCEDGCFTIRALCSGKMIDVPGAAKNSKTEIHQWEKNGTDAQKFYILPSGNGYFGIIPKCNNLKLDVKFSNTDNNTPIQCYESNGTNAQKFKFNRK